MSKPAEQIREDYEAFDQYIIDLVRSHAEFIRSSDLTLERRLSNLEKGQEQLILMVKNLDANLKSYREDSKEFMLKTEISNEKFRQEMRQEFDSFRKENDENFEKIDQQLDLVNANVVDQMLDNTALKTMGWKSKVSLQEGLQTSYHWFLQNIA